MAASLPVISAARSWRRFTVGSSPNQSSPTSASPMARRIASDGFVTVSERRSMDADIAGQYRKTPMRVLIVGTGGVGGYYGARLQEAGHDVRFLARGRNLEALRTRGLTLKSDLGDLELPEVHASEKADGPVDVALICVKTYDNDSAA